MEIKKNPKQQLENFSKIFFQIGLVLILFVIYSLMEYKTYDSVNVSSLGELTMVYEMKEDIPIVKIQKIEINQTIAPPPPAFEDIKVVKDNLDIPETIIESTETDENEAITDAVVTTDEIIEVAEGEEILEDVPFILIEDVPVYPGCKGNNSELKKCFTRKITEYIGENFDTSLAKELGLVAGKKKLYVMFRVSRNGQVTSVQVRGPHPRLEKEVVAVLTSLPRMTPGKQRGIAVSVSYSIPITFEVR